MSRKMNTIKCPYCGARYLPGEIYLPKTFLGEPTKVYRDEKGNILGFDGTDMNLNESYTCDYCGKKFFVETSVLFKTETTKDVFSK